MHRRAELFKRILFVFIILIATQGDAAERAKLTLGYSRRTVLQPFALDSRFALVLACVLMIGIFATVRQGGST